ncbi:kelch-like protein 10 [Centroberyx affinis]|uniref:kelch-like protein 10 n=1 Tax=Centroberyx affinis TaxID=166261 RepID=UPI003A5C1F56
MSATTCSVINKLRLEGKLCDVVIRVDGVEFNAHKIVLCGCSSYFRALFTNGWTTSEQRLYNIPGLSPSMMRLIIEYAYTCSVPVTEENVVELLAAADQFSVMGIAQACCDFLEDRLCLENCVGIWRLVDLYSCPDLRRKAYLFILHHFEEMLHVSEEYLDLPLQQLAGIIQKDQLNVKQESTVFDVVVRWIAHLPEKRSGHISVLLPMVRLASLTADYFLNSVKNNALVKDSSECRPIIITALRAICDFNMKGPSKSDCCNPLTNPRLPYALLLAIGGLTGGRPTNGIEAYDARADRWVKETNDAGSARAYHGVAVLNSVVYCIGGFDTFACFNSVCKFNPVTRTWQQVEPMNSRRCYVSVAVLNGYIYAIGGFDGHMRLRTAERYDPETNKWTQIASMLQRRSDAGATALHGKVYICGGYDGFLYLQTAECYNPETNQWTRIARMSSRRSGVGVVAYGEHIYAVGGINGINCLSSAEAYDPRTNTWRPVASMFNARRNFGIAVANDQLFVVGGFSGLTSTFAVERYDEKTDEWVDAHHMETARSGLSCCVVHGVPEVDEDVPSVI